MPVLVALAVLAVTGRVLAAGGDGRVARGTPVTLVSDEVHEGKLVSLGGPVQVAGRVTGDVLGVGSSVQVNGTVDGHVTAVGGSVSLGPDAVVRGHVHVVGGSLNRAPGAQVLGQATTRFGLGRGVVTAVQRLWASFTPLGWTGWSWSRTLWTILNGVMLFAVAAIVHALFPRQVGRWMEAIEADSWRTGAIGLAAIALFVPIVFTMVISVIGIPAAVVMVGLYALAWLGGYAALAMVIGRKLLAGHPAMLALGTGVVVLALLRHVPLVGPLTAVVVAALALGAVVQTLFGTEDASPASPAGPAGDGNGGPA